MLSLFFGLVWIKLYPWKFGWLIGVKFYTYLGFGSSSLFAHFAIALLGE
jgi:hypothetical protein